MASGWTSTGRDEADGAGPVLLVGGAGDAVLAAIREENALVEVVERGSYVRVRAQGGCRVSRAAIERHAHRPFALPGDLEPVMPSFHGKLSVTDDEVRWDPFAARMGS